MQRCLSLISFTDQGIREVKDTVTRASRFRSKVESAGGQVVGLYWSVGEADGAVIFETPDEATATQLLLGLGREGNVRTRTLRLYNDDEFATILAKT
jgi:uncharacterized protein with GYD domain